MTISGKINKPQPCGEQLRQYIGRQVTIDACVHKVRTMSGFSFVVLRTGRYLYQAVYQPDTCKTDINKIKDGYYITAVGTVREEPRAFFGVEIVLDNFTVLSMPAADYPLSVGNRRLGCGLEANLDNRSVALRNPYEKAAFKLQEGLANGFREFMQNNGFTEIHSPKIVAAGAEGGANIFKLDYFEQKAYLAQSPQFYKQTTVAIFDRVFEVGPVFRAERHNTSRHLNEYTGLDFEMGYIDSMYDVMEMEAAMLRYTMDYIVNNYKYELDVLQAEIPDIKEIPSVKFADAIELIKGRSGKNKYDLEPEDEVMLCKWAKEKYDSDFVFVTHFPSAKRPFYAMDDREEPKFALSFDLLFRGLEITTGGQRINDYTEQVEKMKRMGLNPDEFETYLKIHKYGMPPHGGLGIGLERLLMKLLNQQNIRQASMFPRDINRLDP